MIIGFYIHHTSLKAGGIFTHSTGILKLLVKSEEIKKIHLIISSNQIEYFQKIIDNPKIQLDIIDRKNLFVNIRFAFYYILSIIVALYRNAFKNADDKKLLSTFLQKLNPYSIYVTYSEIDILHVPFQYSPIYYVDIPIIITMHDIQEYHFPENFSYLQKLHRKINNIIAMNESDQIIVSYNHIKNDLLKFFSIEENKISVCPPLFAGEWFLTENVTPETELKQKYDLNERFLLYPAATWRHKNHINLIKAIVKLIEDNFTLQLICTGNITEYYETIETEIKKLNLQENVKFLGIVPEPDLLGLYKTTSLVVIPTLYEAGSGPLYEAMRYSVPVICSNVTSLPETIGKDNFTFNPNNVEEIADSIKKMLNSESLRLENINNSKKQLESFNSVDCVLNYINVYKKLLKR